MSGYFSSLEFVSISHTQRSIEIRREFQHSVVKTLPINLASNLAIYWNLRRTSMNLCVRRMLENSILEK